MATEQIDTSLEDEKLISHLSGTLTFSDIASLDNAKSGQVDSSSTIPANDVVENCAQSQRIMVAPQAVRFEVINASIVEEKGHKHVNYTILVMQSVGFDSMPGKIQKRYSELSSLKSELEAAYPSLMHDVPFPPKRIVGNFSPSTLSSRSKAFEKFLTYIFSINELRFSKPFIRFLYGNSLLEGYRLIENGLYERASDILVASWKLQNKIVPTKSYQCLMTLVAVVASYLALGNVDQAQLFADLSLQSSPDLQREFSASSLVEPKWLVAILRTNMNLCRAMGRDTKRYETSLQDLKEKGISIDQKKSLLEMVLHSKQLWHSIVEEGVGHS